MAERPRKPPVAKSGEQRGVAPDQQRGGEQRNVDPRRVMEKMAGQIGGLTQELVVAQVLIEDLTGAITQLQDELVAATSGTAPAEIAG